MRRRPPACACNQVVKAGCGVRCRRKAGRAVDSSALRPSERGAEPRGWWAWGARPRPSYRPRCAPVEERPPGAVPLRCGYGSGRRARVAAAVGSRENAVWGASRQRVARATRPTTGVASHTLTEPNRAEFALVLSRPVRANAEPEACLGRVRSGLGWSSSTADGIIAIDLSVRWVLFMVPFSWRLIEIERRPSDTVAAVGRLSQASSWAKLGGGGLRATAEPFVTLDPSAG